jgi:antitoxin (DNA-binding transcriptional repressor) of toxin-antitoxin stability system
MKQVSISELRANLLKYLQQVHGGETIDVTSKGVVLASLVPPLAAREAARDTLARLAETAVIHDVVAPIDEEWDAAQ